MKYKTKRLILTLVVMSVVVLTGCGKSAEDKKNDGKLTRAEYIGMLGNSFGYNSYVSETDIFSDVSSDNEFYSEIQAVAEWQIVEVSDEFEPNEEATLGFALQSAVRAIDLDDIEAAGESVDADDLESFYVENIAQIDISDLDSTVDVETAELIIDYAKEYENNLELPQITEVEFVEGVKMADAGMRLNADGQSGVLFKEDSYNVGDVVYFDATDTSIARAIKITSIDGLTFTFEDAPLEETYSYINVQGTFSGKVVEVVSASDSSRVGLADEIYDEMRLYGMSAKDEYALTPLSNSVSAEVERGSDSVVFTANYDVQETSELKKKSGTVEMASDGNVVVGIKNIQVAVDYEHKGFNIFDPEAVDCKLFFDTEVSAAAHGSVAVSIPLGEAYIQVWGPFNLKLSLTAHIGADGNVSISYTTENVVAVGWKEGTGLAKSFDSTPSVDFEADTTLTAKATALADVRLGYKKVSYSLVNTQFTTGAVGVGKTEVDLLGEQPTCLDLQLYVPLEWGVNQEGCLLTDISEKLKYSTTIWDSSNSPVKLHIHLEDWIRTPGDECTRGEAVEQELVTPEGEPLEEIDPFEFEMIEFDFIELDSYTMYLAEGESLDIGFTNIPEGYTQTDLVYEVEDSSVCSVSNGSVRANGAGSTIIKIKTSDGVFTVTLAVTVNEDYSIEGFQSL